MTTITGPQLLAFAIQYNAMADEIDDVRFATQTSDPDLKISAQALRATADKLAASAILATLDSLAIHYDAMLATVKNLNRELAFEQHVARALAYADAALAIAAAALQGNPLAVTTALANAAALFS